MSRAFAWRVISHMEANVIEMARHTSILGLLGIVVALATTAYSAIYAWRPTEARLALIRPLSLATIFAALCSFNASVANIFAGLSVTGNFGGTGWRDVAQGTSETFVALLLAFGCLAISWLFVAAGIRRTS
jgi:hypothetical protein